MRRVSTLTNRLTLAAALTACLCGAVGYGADHFQQPTQQESTMTACDYIQIARQHLRDIWPDTDQGRHPRSSFDERDIMVTYDQHRCYVWIGGPNFGFASQQVGPDAGGAMAIIIDRRTKEVVQSMGWM